MPPKRKRSSEEGVTAIVKGGKLSKKQRTFTITEKSEIVHRVEAGELMAGVARFYSVNESTVCTMMKKKEEIKQAFIEASPRALSNIYLIPQDPYIPKMEKALFVWMEDCRQRNICCNMPIVMEMARSIYSELLDKDGVEDRSKFKFVASRGWLEKFKRRYNIDNKPVDGEGN